jgi:hypothetical protein
MLNVSKIEYSNKLYAIILRRSYDKGVNFVTENSNSLQLGFSRYAENDEIKPHIHNAYDKIIHDTQEILHIEYGKVEVNCYHESGELIGSTVLEQGDTVLLIAGGHGLRILEDSDIIEIKQGYYESKQKDKTYLEVDS